MLSNNALSIEKIEIGIEIEFSDMKIIEIEVPSVYRYITIICYADAFFARYDNVIKR
jgi:hypothetical protein